MTIAEGVVQADTCLLHMIERHLDSDVIAVIAACEVRCEGCRVGAILWYNPRLVRGSALWLVRTWALSQLTAGRRFAALGLHQIETWPPL